MVDVTNLQQKPHESQTKIQELESIRGLAALLVVILHSSAWNASFYDCGIIRNGYLMVELFFVLSGYVIYYSYSTKITNSKQLLHFQFLRFGRLYPVHILFLSVFLFFVLAKYIANKYGIVSPNAQLYSTGDILPALFQNIFLIQAIGPTGHALMFNAPSWSISVEFYTYLLFGLVVLFFNKLKDILFFALFLISILLLINQRTFGFEALLDCYSGFFLGCLTAKLKANTKINVPSMFSIISFSALIIFLSFKSKLQYDYLTYFFTAALIFTLVSSSTGVLKQLLNLKALTWLGTISYSVYMSHFAIVWIANQFFRFVLRKPERTIDGASVPQLSFLEATIAVLLIISIVLIVSNFVYAFIEKPLRLKSRQVVFG